VLMTSLTLEAVREARINKEGECRAMERAMCSPRELGLTPTSRTRYNLQYSSAYPEKQRCISTIFALDLLRECICNFSGCRRLPKYWEGSHFR
jgi:hypothetical protein